MKKLLTIITLTTILLIILTYNERINASTTENWATKEVKIYTCHDDTCNWSNNYTANHTFSGSDLTYPVHAIEWRVKATNGLSIENSYTFSFGYKPTPDSLHPKTYFMRRNAQSSKETITCQTSTDSNGYYMYKCTFTPNEDYTSSEWLYIQIQYYDSYITNLNTKITAFEERQGTNSIITQQTNEIIQQNEQNTQNIINNNNENTQTIINNQNNNTQQQIEAQKVCTPKGILNKKLLKPGYVAYDGTISQIITNEEAYYSEFIKVEQNTDYTFFVYDSQWSGITNDNWQGVGLYTSKNYNSFLIRRTNTIANQTYFTFNSGLSNYIILSARGLQSGQAVLVKGIKTEVELECKNGNQALIDQDYNYNGNTDNLNDAIDEEEEIKESILEQLTGDIEDLEPITIETEPSNFIWNIITTLKNINEKIAGFFISVLSLGIIKMALNR